MKKIIIAGDSWGCGEWYYDFEEKTYGVTHTGLEHYFTDIGFDVINVSEGGSSNANSVSRLENALFKISDDINDTDYIFFITTDATRDLDCNKEILTDTLIQNQSLPLLVDRLLDSCYNKLNKLCLTNNLNIHMIGGLSNLDTSVQSYKNLIPIIPSWISLLVGHFDDYKNICDDSKFRILSNSKFTIDNINLNRCPLNIANKLIEDLYLYQEVNSLVFRESIFRPDGVHPNREGHKILFETLLKKL
jgi:hypothetical protein